MSQGRGTHDLAKVCHTHLQRRGTKVRNSSFTHPYNSSVQLLTHIFIIPNITTCSFKQYKYLTEVGVPVETCGGWGGKDELPGGMWWGGGGGYEGTPLCWRKEVVVVEPEMVAMLLGLPGSVCGKRK